MLQEVKVGWMTASAKPGGVRGIVVGHVFWKLVARTIVQHCTVGGVCAFDGCNAFVGPAPSPSPHEAMSKNPCL